MKIHLSKKYKSLQPFSSEELPDFTVIIGKNGSGKSQLIQKFFQLSKAKSDTEKKNSGFAIEPQLNRLHCEQIVAGVIPSIQPTEFRKYLVRLYELYNGYILNEPIFKVWQNLNQKKIDTFSAELNDLKAESFDDIMGLKELFSFHDSRFVDSDLISYGYQTEAGPSERRTIQAYKSFLKELKDSFRTYFAGRIVAQYHGKSLINLTENDFVNADLPDKYVFPNDLIDSQIENVFYSFLKKRHYNDYKHYKKSKYNQQNPSVSPEEFNSLNENPIIKINNILRSLGLAYKFREIDDAEYSPESIIHFDFIKTTTNSNITLQDLSSGEKIIIGLVLRLFTSEFYKSDLSFPDLIVLDEPDAHLHPEMSKLLIEVLNNTFVRKLGIKIIITTHSPTTVALAPEDSIFQLNNEPVTFLKKIDKDNALKMLTSGVPNLSIDYKNHRQIFVESPTDLLYYQTLFDKIHAEKKLNHQLYFISNGYGKGSCEQVKKTVGDLRKAGNSTSFAVIDWDNKNRSDDFVSVHGELHRYSMENYIFDPLYVAIFLLERNYGKLKDAIQFKSSDNQYKLIEEGKAQKAIDFITSVLEPRNKTAFSSGSIECTYGDYKLIIPKWYAQIHGHTLKEQLKDAFEPISNLALKSEYEPEICHINVIGKLYPNVPKDTVDLLLTLAK